MKNLLLFIIIALIPCCLKSQNTPPKFQARIGIRGVKIDSNPFTTHTGWINFSNYPFEPNLEFRFRIKPKHLIGLEYGNNYGAYFSFLTVPKDTTLMERGSRTINLSYLYSLKNHKRFEWSIGGNMGYRFSTWEWYHLAWYTLPFDKVETNEMRYHPNAFSLGLSTDLMFRLKWGLFLHGKVGYHRYFSEYAPNELRVVLGAGWEF